MRSLYPQGAKQGFLSKNCVYMHLNDSGKAPVFVLPNSEHTQGADGSWLLFIAFKEFFF